MLVGVNIAILDFRHEGHVERNDRLVAMCLRYSFNMVVKSLRLWLPGRLKSAGKSNP